MTPVLEAAFLGVLQGITEFLPVSSSGHLAVSQMVFGVEEGGLTLNVMLHAGTLIATIIVLRERVRDALVEGVRALVSPSRFTTTSGGRDALFVILASIPTGVIGLLLEGPVERYTFSPGAVGLGFVITTAMLISTHWKRDGRKEVPGVAAALLIGVAQGLAVLPGVSRSGSTIAVALWLGVKRERAFELSMLMSIPAVLGAVGLKLPDAVAAPSGIGAAALGASVALVSGIGAMLILRRVVTQGRFAWFALWVGPLALATLAMAKAWPGG